MFLIVLCRCYLLELGFAGGAGEGDDVADVGHTSDEEHETLESETEAPAKPSSKR